MALCNTRRGANFPARPRARKPVLEREIAKREEYTSESEGEIRFGCRGPQLLDLKDELSSPRIFKIGPLSNCLIEFVAKFAK